jgi:tyrosinase
MRPILKPLDPTCNHLRRWSVTARKEAFYSTFNSTESDEQMELMMCKFYDECLGKIRDYTREFRKNFQVKGSPRCYTLLRSLKSKKKKIKVHRWRSIMYQFYDCPAEGKTQFLEAMERE